jgi:hypothetical protein
MHRKKLYGLPVRFRIAYWAPAARFPELTGIFRLIAAALYAALWMMPSQVNWTF